MSRLVDIAEGFQAHASGALWLCHARTAVIADAHLGYGWAQRRRGQLGPVVDQMATQKLTAVINELQPESIVFLGDVVHAPRPAPRERELIETTLRSIASQARVVIVLGNHDRGFARDYPQLGIELVKSWSYEGTLALHGDKPSQIAADRFIIGHLHPAIGVHDDAGVSHRIPIFLIGPHAYVLPAFSPFAAGFNINAGLPRDMQNLLGNAIEVIAATGNRALRLGPLTNLRSRAP